MKLKNIMLLSIGIISTSLLLSSCATIPKGVKPVEGFQVNKYLGTWYEIARFDYRFEKNLDNVTADYSLKDNGKIKVLNQGYDYKKEVWKSSIGKAKSKGETNTGALKVSFFGPFYSGYNVIALSGDYEYALVAGKNFDYLWILSRTKSIPEDVKKEFIDKASALGFEVEDLIWVNHDKQNPNK